MKFPVEDMWLCPVNFGTHWILVVCVYLVINLRNLLGSSFLLKVLFLNRFSVAKTIVIFNLLTFSLDCQHFCTENTAHRPHGEWRCLWQENSAQLEVCMILRYYSCMFYVQVLNIKHFLFHYKHFCSTRNFLRMRGHEDTMEWQLQTMQHNKQQDSSSCGVLLLKVTLIQMIPFIVSYN